LAQAAPNGHLYPDGRVCNRCGQLTPLTALKSARNGYYYPFCARCQFTPGPPRLGPEALNPHFSELRYHGEARTIEPPDPEPARRVRRALEQDRDAGLPWSDERFREHLANATASDGTWRVEAEDAGWRDALRATRWAWQEAYEQVGDRLLALTAG
jgi:hypothetical protein